LFALIREELDVLGVEMEDQKPTYRDFRSGDVRHSLADISKAQRLLGYQPTHRIRQGLACALNWYRKSSLVSVTAAKDSRLLVGHT
jgi:UDP-N-acetylglucosamine/UDP-N-acetylgalactosamine 4-epimerase